MSPLEIVALVLLAWMVLWSVMRALTIVFPHKTPLQDCKGDIALITGGSQGLGWYLSMECAKYGIHPLLVARNKDTLEQAVKRIQEAYPGVDAQYIVADLSTPEGVSHVVDTISSLDKPVTILINNLGGQTSGWKAQPYHKMSMEDVKTIFDLNGMPLYALAHALLPKMLQLNRGGIMAISSLSYKYMPYLIPYATEKAKVNAFMLGLGQELVHTNVVAQSMVAGGMWTPGLQRFLTEEERARGGPGFAAAHPKDVASCFMRTFGRGSVVRVPYWTHWILDAMLEWLVPDVFKNIVIQKMASAVAHVTHDDY